MNNRVSILILFLSWVFIITACNNTSTGNHLHQINKVQFEGVDSTYSLFLGDTLTIKPKLHFTKDSNLDTSRYTFDWFALGAGGGFAGFDKHEFAKTKGLNVIISLAPGKYIGYYRVKDKKTGVQWTKKFNLGITSNIYEGWLLMTGVNGVARLGMISFFNDKAHIYNDVLAFSNSSLTLEGAPVGISTRWIVASLYGIYVSSTGTGTTKIDNQTFDWDQGLRFANGNYVKGNFSQDFQADFFQCGPTPGVCYMYADGNIYYVFQSWNFYFDQPINKLSDENKLFKAAPYLGYGNGIGSFVPAIIYDETNKRFLQHTYTNAYHVSKLPKGTLFDYNTGKDLIYMTGNTYNAGGTSGGTVFAILDSANTYYLAEIFVSSSEIRQTYYDKMTATDIQQAEHFAISPVNGYIFYNVGSKVYEYDPSSRNTKLMLDKGTDKISYLDFNKGITFVGVNTAAFNKLLVGVYNPSAPAEISGTLEIYNVPGVQQQITLDKSYSGFGKIVDVDYRERK
jgi:hypothetical protein